MRHLLRSLGISATVLLGAIGCATNPYAKFYQGMADARQEPGYESSGDGVQLFSSNDLNRDGLLLLQRGYVFIGQSAFNASMSGVKESQLREQAAHVGAQLVLVASRYTNSASGAIPVSLPTTSTTTSSATATMVGGGGSATAYGTATSTTSGSQIVLIPYSVQRGDFTALYFARVRARLGLYVAPLDDSVRARLQSNSGVKVLVVSEGSPAFDADVLPGDVLKEMGGSRVSSPEVFKALLDANEGKTIELLLDRSGHEVRKTVTIAAITHR